MSAITVVETLGTFLCRLYTRSYQYASLEYACALS